MSAHLPISITKTENSRLAEVDWDQIGFSEIFADHMLEADYRDGAWQSARIRPYGPLELPPSITALHYGLSVFEGMKAHKTPDGQPVLFRPRDNARRLNRSAARLVMPPVPEELFLEGVKTLVRLDADWIPQRPGFALYVRPFLFSTEDNIIVKPAERYKFVVFLTPVCPLFGEPVRLWVTRNYVRAFPGGTGDAKPAGNYAAAFLAAQEAQEHGCHNVLWLDGMKHRFIEECGVMNVFMVIDGTVVTPSLEDGTILPGITRDSAITVLRDQGLAVEERRISLDELVEAHDAGRLSECFGTGTAATIAPIGLIRSAERTVELPPAAQWKIAPALLERLKGLASGRGDDPYGWAVRL